MFWRKRQPEVELNEAAYERWLRAQRPDMRWFLAQSEADQEAMAAIGDLYQTDLHLAAAKAIRDPQTVELGMKAAAGDQEAELSLLQKVAGAVAARASSQPEPLSFAGISERRAESERRREERRNAGYSFLGRQPRTVTQ